MTTTTLVMSVNEEMADLSTKFLYSSALVLTLAMLAFCLDLAGGPGRAARALARQEEAEDASAAVEEGGDTAVVTKVAAEPEVPEKRSWAGIGISLSWLGTLLLGASVLTRSLSVNRPPLGNMYEFALVGSLFVMLSYLIWSLRHDVRWLGAFVTGVVVLFEMLAAVVFFTDASQLMPSLRSYWLSIHVSVATLSMALFTVAFVLHSLWFVQTWRESRPNKLAFMNAVPAPQTLDRLAYGILIIAFPLWTFTVIAGAVWAQEAWGHYWNWDPKEVWSLVIWVLYAAYLHARMTVGWSGRKSIYVAMAGFACILINYGIVNVFFVGQHSYSGM
ncbi:c-type cytochrome biogenesis protein CcsB [Yimella sp. cx-51]|uniref:c-type cytochrome biogenesis protein CcsB n=1 Tax=Yimella sp. cx-51 TaxID=2770551 RepID=UPI001FCBC18E|nr:c-type cytochrome biogenesis protein CcsB [Yimella sp. cx-51]